MVQVTFVVAENVMTENAGYFQDTKKMWIMQIELIFLFFNKLATNIL